MPDFSLPIPHSSFAYLYVLYIASRTCRPSWSGKVVPPSHNPNFVPSLLSPSPLPAGIRLTQIWSFVLFAGFQPHSNSRQRISETHEVP